MLNELLHTKMVELRHGFCEQTVGVRIPAKMNTNSGAS